MCCTSPPWRSRPCRASRKIISCAAACSPFTTGRDRRSGTALRRLNEPPARRDNNNTRRTDSDPDTGGAHHAVATPRSKHDYDNNQSHTCRRTTWQKAADTSLLRVSLLVCWLIWVLNAYDREMILRLGPVISKEFSLSPEQWGNIVALIMVALAVLDIPAPSGAIATGLAGNERAFRYRWCWAIPRCLLFPG